MELNANIEALKGLTIGDIKKLTNGFKCEYCDKTINNKGTIDKTNKKYHGGCYKILMDNDPYFSTSQGDYNTICLNCETRYTKPKFLFSYCPNCKGKNLKELKK